jgi:hypothetical protein
VATFSAVTRQHILRAIEEYDDRGRESFLGVYGFTPSPDATLTHDGRTYDAKAILGVAHRYATGRLATSEEFHDGAATLLQKRGFQASGSTTAAPSTRRPAQRSTTPRSASPRTSARRSPADEKPPAVCPTCFMALPATGICDNCA